MELAGKKKPFSRPCGSSRWQWSVVFPNKRASLFFNEYLAQESTHLACCINGSCDRRHKALTGYTDAMMKIVQPGAAAQGYTVDCLVTPDHLPAGRPAPYMIYRNMTELAIPSVDEVVKVGDTIADIREGLNAKVCSVGVITGSNELGLTEEEYKTMPEPELYTLKQEVRERMMAAVLARTGNFVWLYEEHRDNDRTKFWSMSCSRNPR